MNCYKALIQYDGSLYQGFQFVPGGRSIQGDLNQSLARIFKHEFTTRAASRTDKGVHALAQVVKISSEDSTPLSTVLLNQHLPKEIRCLDLTTCAREFIPSMDQKTKEYRYLFSFKSERFIAHSADYLDFVSMQKCAQALKGVHDFKNFWSIGGVSNSTIRDILECDLTQVNPQDFFKDSLFSTELKECFEFKIIGTGFLKHMVRHLMGALFMVGEKRMSVDEFMGYLQGELKAQRPWKKADPKGLFLVKVSYA